MDRMYWMHFAIAHPFIEGAGVLALLALVYAVHWWSER